MIFVCARSGDHGPRVRQEGIRYRARLRAGRYQYVRAAQHRSGRREHRDRGEYRLGAHPCEYYCSAIAESWRPSGRGRGAEGRLGQGLRRAGAWRARPPTTDDRAQEATLAYSPAAPVKRARGDIGLRLKVAGIDFIVVLLLASRSLDG